MWLWIVVVVFVVGSSPGGAQDADTQTQTQNFTSYFADCKRGEDGFDDCIKKALNGVRPFFKTGVPELNIPPFDPFFAKEVVQKRGVFALNYRLVLRNVIESGWTQSEVTSFRSDPVLNLVQYTQFFPEKYLEGEYETSSQVLITPPDNRGVWNMTLYNYVQTTTISRPRGADRLKVRIDVQKIGNMDIHVSNLLRGRRIIGQHYTNMFMKVMLVHILKRYKLSTEMDIHNLRKKLVITLINVEGYKVILENRCLY